MKKFFWLVILVIVILVAALVIYLRLNQSKATEVAAQPNSDLIQVFDPNPNEIVSSPLVIKGQARGTWFFEAVFPIRLLDANGNELAQSQGQAKSDWLTGGFVPFESTIVFGTPETACGILVFRNDNPSGRASSAKEFRVPICFKK